MSFYHCENSFTSQSPATFPSYPGAFQNYEHNACPYPPELAGSNFYETFDKPYPDEHQDIMFSNGYLQDQQSVLNQEISFESLPQTVTDSVFGNPPPLPIAHQHYLQQHSNHNLENWGVMKQAQPPQIPYDRSKSIAPMKPSDSMHGRRNLKHLLQKSYNFDKTQYLILYTYQQLKDPNCDDIVWTDRANGIFYIYNPDEFARKWGEYKRKPAMSYQKVSRSFRYYYKSKLLRKWDGLRQYKWDKKSLESLEEVFKNGTPLLPKTINKKL